jgi:DNA-binding NarL/FixJ family response regulator
LVRKQNRKKTVLSQRELEILQLYTIGFTITEIAKTIFVSPDTVKFNRRKLFEKLEADSITEAIAYAISGSMFSLLNWLYL